jgi:hypothetical protein
MAQNSQSATATRNTIPGTANDAPVAPSLFTAAPRRAKALLRQKDAPAQARMEAGDMLDRTALDHGPLAAAVAFLILLGLMLMYFSVNGT